MQVPRMTNMMSPVSTRNVTGQHTIKYAVHVSWIQGITFPMTKVTLHNWRGSWCYQWKEEIIQTAIYLIIIMQIMHTASKIVTTQLPPSDT